MEELELIVGTYEDYVLGYRVEVCQPGLPKAADKTKMVHDGDSRTNCNVVSNRILLEQSFAVRSHSGSVRSLSVSADGSLIFSTGHDEMMNLFNLKKRKLVQTLEGGMNCATFVGSSHILCGSTDGNIYIFECKGSSVTQVKTLRGHKSSVISMDAHRSGKVLLSLSTDSTMRTWNLIKGRSAFVTHIKSNAHMVKWSKFCNEFVLAANDEVYFYGDTGTLKHTIKLERRINAVEFITEHILVIAIDCGRLSFFDLRIDELNPTMTFDAHSARIKSLSCFHIYEEKATNDDSIKHCKLATASSDGSIKIWSLADLNKNLTTPRELASVDLGARLTCMISAIRRVDL